MCLDVRFFFFPAYKSNAYCKSFLENLENRK